MESLSTAVKPGVRGVSWQRKEILDLLAFWGDARVQQILKSSRRNLDSFQEIAEKMAARGHSRTAAECRSKAKAMRLQYKAVVCHNNRSGAGRVECPYYEELDRILKGDASVTPVRIVRSFKVRRRQPTQPTWREDLASQPSQPPLREDLASQFPTVNVSDIFSENSEENLTDPTQEDTNDSATEGHDGGTSTQPTSALDRSYPSTSAHHDGTEGMTAATQQEGESTSLSPSSKMANLRQRKKRNMLSTRLLEQGASEHRESMELFTSCNNQLLSDQWAMQREKMDLLKQRSLEEAEESRAFQASMDRTVSCIETLTQVMVQAMTSYPRTQQSYPIASSHSIGAPHTESLSSERPKRKVKAKKHFSPDE